MSASLGSPPLIAPMTVNGQTSTEWAQFLDKQARTADTLTQSGVTANRPTNNLWVGRPFFDTTLGHPIWYDGTNWVDATGATV